MVVPQRFDKGQVLYETVHGSRAYGLATESSDTDRRGIFIPSREESPLPEAADPSPLDELLVRLRRAYF